MTSINVKSTHDQMKRLLNQDYEIWREKMTFLAFDGRSLADTSHPLYEIGALVGVLRLLQPWKFRLHGTLGRRVIVRTALYGKGEYKI